MEERQQEEVVISTKVKDTRVTTTTTVETITTPLKASINFNNKIKTSHRISQPNPPNQMVVYIPNNNPGVAGGTQGDPRQGT
jgi:hypothetical protein